MPKPRQVVPTEPTFGFGDETPVKEPTGKLKGKKKTTKPETLAYVKTKPQEPEPDIEFVRYDKPGPFYDPIVNLQVQREIRREERRSLTPERDRDGGIQSRIRDTPSEKSATPKETTPKKLTPPIKQVTPPKQREPVRERSPIRIEDREEPKVHLSMERYNVPTRSQEIRPRESVGEESLMKAKGNNDWLMDHLIE